MPIDLKPLGCGLLAIVVIVLALASPRTSPEPRPRPDIAWDPARTLCYRVASPPTIDGILDETAWRETAQVLKLRDAVRGDTAPRFDSSFGLLWDDRHLYVAAAFTAEHVWAVRTQPDTDLSRDSHFAMFIDADGDTHDYYEIVINALGAVSDVLFATPFRDGENPDDWSRNIRGLRVEVHVDGTLNNSGDVDRGWSLEAAIPWDALAEHTSASCPPEPGDRWRMNFARMVWPVAHVNGGYAKIQDPETGDNLAPELWSWSPQGIGDMHHPEMWGYVQFSDRATGEDTIVVDFEDELARRTLREIYYLQRDRRHQGDAYARDVRQLSDLSIDVARLRRHGIHWPPRIVVESLGYTVTLVREGRPAIEITQDGRIQER